MAKEFKGYAKVKFNFSEADYNRKVEEILQDARNGQPQLLKDVIRNFAKEAMKALPPNFNKTKIDKDLYNRNILKLRQLIYGGYRGLIATDEDKEKFKNKFKFKVLFNGGKTKFSQNVGLKPQAYTKTWGEAKRLAKIDNRGLLKASWGLNLEQKPKEIEALIRKAPRLSTYSISDTKFTQESPDKLSITLINRHRDIDRFERSSKVRGMKGVENMINNFLRRITKKQYEL